MPHGVDTVRPEPSDVVGRIGRRVRESLSVGRGVFQPRPHLNSLRPWTNCGDRGKPRRVVPWQAPQPGIVRLRRPSQSVVTRRDGSSQFHDFF